MTLNKEWIHKITVGALKDTIKIHGNITPSLIGSAAKRVAGRIHGEIKKVKNNELIRTK